MQLFKWDNPSFRLLVNINQLMNTNRKVVAKSALLWEILRSRISPLKCTSIQIVYCGTESIYVLGGLRFMFSSINTVRYPLSVRIFFRKIRSFRLTSGLQIFYIRAARDVIYKFVFIADMFIVHTFSFSQLATMINSIREQLSQSWDGLYFLPELKELLLRVNQ